MDAKGPTAESDEVEDYLRNLDANDWGQSLDVAVKPRKAKAKKAAVPKPKSKPQPVLKIRDAKAADAPALARLIRLLDHDVDENGVRKRLAALNRQKLPQLVATLDKAIVGLAGLDSMLPIHRNQPVGRITILVVAEDARRHGIGQRLIECAEDRLRKLGCGMVEVTSNDRLTEAHAFYRHMGYERTSFRFFKKL
jgi:GNAT superfamily N-acetyltransferase